MSTTAPAPAASVYVTGDVMIAHDILHPSGDGGKHVSYAPDQQVEIYKQSGGAWHMSAMLKALLKDEAMLKDEAVSGRIFDPKGSDIEDAPQAHTLWVPFDRTLDKKDGRTFRVKEYQGTKRTAGGAQAGPAYGDEGAGLAEHPVLLVVDEGYGQLKPPTSDGKTQPAGRPAGAWLVHKSFLPLSEIGSDDGPKPTAAAWHRWTATQRSVAVVSIGGLRSLSRRVGTAQSWQRTIREVQSALSASNELQNFPYVVVVCGCAAVLVLERAEGHDGKTVEFDGVAILHRGELEGEYADRHPGKIVGYGSCVTAHVVAALSAWLGKKGADAAPEPIDLGKVSCHTGSGAETAAAAIVNGAKQGLIAARLLQAVGYIHTDNMPSCSALSSDKAVKDAQVALAKVEAKRLETDASREQVHQWVETRTKKRQALIKLWTEQLKPVPAQEGAPRPEAIDELNPTTWAVTNSEGQAADRLDVGKGLQVVPLCQITLPQREDQTKALASSLVTQGFEALAGNHPIPYATFGKLKEYDPDQIDTLCTLRRLLTDHRAGHGKKPLSLAVFGPPGAGKSFTVKAIAEAQGWSEDKRNILEFNLSQLPSAEALFDALHQVASAGVKEPPLVFFDEFDTSLGGQRLGWLRYFLAPMQDGDFSVGTRTYQLGRPVLVFAGGTAASAKAFGHAPQMSDIDLRAAKLPDFLSRLRATLDIPSVNPATGDGRGLHHLRRALIVRQNLANLAPQLCPDDTMKIEKGVLDALLCAPSYLHGARSIEAILTNSHLKGAQRFTASLLPPRHLLELHTDAGAFMQLVERKQ